MEVIIILQVTQIVLILFFILRIKFCKKDTDSNDDLFRKEINKLIEIQNKVKQLEKECENEALKALWGVNKAKIELLQTKASEIIGYIYFVDFKKADDIIKKLKI